MKKQQNKKRRRKRQRNKRIRMLIIVVVLAVIVLTRCQKNPSEEGLTLLQEEQYEEAIVQFQEAIDDKINVGDAYRGIGIAKWELEDYEGAKEAFENALNNDAELTPTLYNFLGACEFKLNDYKRALNYYQLGMVMEGCSEEMMQSMRFNEIVCYEKMGDWDTAKTKLAEYIVDYPDDTDALKEAEFFETR